MGDSVLIEAVRLRPEIYDKSHAGFKNPAIKTWKMVAEVVGGRSVDNLPPLRTLSPIVIPSPSLSPTLSSVFVKEDEMSTISASSSVIDSLLSEKNIDNPASLPYLGPTDRCKKQKTDETAEMFKETLSNLNKSIASAPVPQTLAPNEPDSLIGKNVELALKSLPNLQLTLQFPKKFRDLIQDCEEAAALYESTSMIFNDID
ncbi:adh transcription factor isoform c [Lasius niger]|uniref:Adh transcription factor isoform c n=1 Tax=Lasius niger TaxID=67767 RepID=A0A0J7MTR5_LASNI|nr:adh transcription factor isoform c [Lasius niger]